MSTETIIAAVAFLTLLGSTFAYLLGRLDRYVTQAEMAAQLKAHSERMNLLYDSITEARNLQIKMMLDQRDISFGAARGLNGRKTDGQ